MMNLVKEYFQGIPQDKYGIDLVKFEEMNIKGQLKGYILLDIREREKFNAFRIAGSINIPFREIGANLERIPKDQKIILICNTGFTAAQTSSLLNLLGYQTWTLRDGIEGYIDIGGEVERTRLAA
ncbi:MAG: rhodanese-like domain-containing protein [Bacillota bacterium]|uniref:Rhodanese domain-containing protein n=1 Tax=Thermanaerosceptrum fracticalcis TaxID=1712410 RepID=A0A7G6E3Y8_THEFR|nr:rhodanese-like domain-containing protein [Thermanaerosceptrum fracticalcis]MBZ4654080.1 copper amine oxidase domain protein [Peptococcaceae bacterium]QNB46792.1 hypothetical protein BR63_11015 [Thermanaerosceptrum fracticalcis]